MYPYIRTAKSFLVDSFRSKISFSDTHISYLICWPWDIDMWGELNNGRVLSLFDLGRHGFSLRAGLFSGYFKYKLYMNVAGVSIRYRHRIISFRRLEMRTRIIFYDERFLYVLLYAHGNSFNSRGDRHGGAHVLNCDLPQSNIGKQQRQCSGKRCEFLAYGRYFMDRALRDFLLTALAS